MVRKKLIFFVIILLISNVFIFLYGTTLVHSYPVTVIDALGKPITIKKTPSRVISLVPSITEIIFAMGAGNALRGITYHSTYPIDTVYKEIIGGFYSPSVEMITKLQPDIIFLSQHHRNVKGIFENRKCQLVQLETRSISDTYKNIILLGKIFGKQNRANEIVADIKVNFQTISKKVNQIPLSRRKRVIRLMGHQETIMAPGDDSFQNEFIKLAGGIPPALQKYGHVVPISEAEWMHFNPEIIYYCGMDQSDTMKLLNRPGWRNVDAIRDGKVFSFPCDLTCRPSIKMARFVSWLSSRIYYEEFSKSGAELFRDEVFLTRPLDIELDYLKRSAIAYSHINDFVNKTLIIEFNQPLTVVSTLEGKRHGITSVGNHYSPPSGWAIWHDRNLNDLKSKLCGVIQKSEESSNFLFTGADMDHLVIHREQFRDISVYSLVTAGVESNALRMSKDKGLFYEPGTINIILLTNMKLSSRAMNRAIITTTEAKTAALMDMDIRSSESPLLHQATGTGTDNIILVEGCGPPVDNSGGHSKMGELIAKAVYEGVKEAIRKQNGLTSTRHIFRRLNERRLNVFGLISLDSCKCAINENEMAVALEEVLLQPKYAGFLESAFSISDDYENGLIRDIRLFEAWSRSIAQQIAGRKIDHFIDFVKKDHIPTILRMSLNAMLNGIHYSSIP
ncbi:MAG: adenosylcobinamide amidohydrolase [Deltaproteobacteria bacterium]|nr:adenosylcobinamide amidohydrolase [Deltaproteobacteria bacterium]